MEAGSLVIFEEMSPSTLSTAVAPGSLKGVPIFNSMVLSPFRVMCGFWVSVPLFPLLELLLLDELLLLEDVPVPPPPHP